MADVAESDVVAAFKAIHEDLSSKQDLVEKCMSVCHQHKLSAASLADEWEAHAMGRSLSDDSSASLLTLSSLAELESVLAKRAAAPHSAPVARKSTSSATPRPSIFTTSSMPKSEAKLREAMSQEGLMSPPLSSKKRANATPPDTPAPFLSPPGNAKVPRATPSGVSPASHQTPPEPGATYAARTNAGARVLDINMATLGHRATFVPSKRLGGARVDIGMLEGKDDINLHQRYRYMYTTMEERARSLERGLLRLQADMSERNALSEDVTAVGVPRQEEVLVVGRVCCEAPEGRINKASVLLEGSRRDSGGVRVKLDLDALSGFALFPGQVIAAEGVNSSGYKMAVKRIVEGVQRPFTTTPASRINEYHHGTLYQGGAPVSILVASGPYTTSDNLEFAPFEDLMRVIAAHKPDVAVLAGPFVDAAHPQVASGDVDISGDSSEVETVDFESLFKMRISMLISSLFQSNPTLATKLVLVPSLNDVFHDHVYPQPPLADRIPGGVASPFFEEESIGDLGLPYAQGEGADRRVYCVSNPSIFRVNEVTFGISTNDILMHLSGDEVSYNQGNRLARLAAHLLQQQSFYPLFPPPAQGLSQLDMRQSDHWRMPITPDVLLLPSKLATFAKDVNGCLVVNPGQLCRGTSGGTFAILHVHALPESTLEAAAPETPLTHNVATRTAVEVLRI